MAESSFVTIQVRVDETNSRGAIDGINQKFGELGIHSTGALKMASSALDEMGHHAASNLDGVRLLSQEFGLRLPRALEAMASRMPIITNTINAALSGIAFVAIAEVAYRAGEAIYKAFDLGGERAREVQKGVADTDLEMRRLNTTIDVQIDKLQQEQAKLEHKPINSMKLTLDEAAAAADNLASKLEEINSKFQKDVLEKMSGNWAANLVTGKLPSGMAELKTMMDEHQKYLNAAKDTSGIIAEDESYGRALQLKLDEFNKKQKDLDKPYGSHGSVSEGNVTTYQPQIDGLKQLMKLQQEELTYSQKNKQRDDAEAKANADRDKEENAKTALEQKLAIMHSEHEAILANMSGQEQAALKLKFDTQELTTRLIGMHEAARIPSAVQELNSKYFAEMSERTVELQRKMTETVSRAQIEAMPEGAGKIDVEHYAKVQQNNTSLTGDERSLANAAAQAEAIRKLGALEGEWELQQDEDAQKDVERFARIQDLETNYAKQAADAQRHIRSTGLDGWVSDYQSAIAAIRAQDDAETARLMQQADALKMTDAQIAQAKQNIDAQANSQIVAQNEQMAHTIASTLESAYKDPVGFIKSQMEKMFFDIIANWIMHLQIFQNLFGKTMGGLQPGAGGAAAGGLGGLLGNILHGGVPSGTAGWGHATAPTAAAGSDTFTPPVLQRSTNSPGISRTVFPDGSRTGGLPAQIAAMAGNTTGLSIPSGTSSTTSGTTGLGSGLPGYGSVSMPGMNVPSVPVPGMGTGVAGGANGVSTALGVGAAGFEAYQATMEAFRGGTTKTAMANSTLKGVLGDAGAGAAIGGPLGAIVGGAIGLGVGLFSDLTGMGGRFGARDYYEKTLFPAIEKDRMGQGSMDFQSAIADVNSIAASGMEYMRKTYGMDAADWVNANYLKKEQTLAAGQIAARAKGGAQYVQMSAAQFHDGGDITGFGSLATSSNEGYIHAMAGETVMNTRAAATHGAVLSAMNGGASATDVARMYLANSPASGGPAVSGGGDTHHHWNVNALDAQSFSSMLKNGGARAITKHLNSYASQYAGDGISG
jgi:hypothetical protein